MRYKYVIEEVYKGRKVLKWIVIVGSELLIYFGIIIIEFTLLALYGILGMLIGLVVIAVAGLIISYYIFSKMFPKENELKVYYTGGLLRRNVNVGVIVNIALYISFLLLVSIVLSFLFPFIHLTATQSYLLYIIVVFALFGILYFLIVPFGLRLPHGKATLKEYTNSIGLTRLRPLARNLIFGILSFLLYGISTLIFANLLGIYTFNPNVLFSTPSFTQYGWAIFYVALQPGIWEELAFRGVILNLQLRKYSKFTSIFVNGVLFGLFHFINLISGQPLIYTLNQVFFATCLGIAFAYLYVKTKSLLPSIMSHYLIDSVGQLTTNAQFLNVVNYSFFLTFGVGLVPMGLILLVFSLIARSKKT